MFTVFKRNGDICMKRKKVLSFIMMGLLAFSLASCGSDNKSGGDSSTSGTQESNTGSSGTPGSVVNADDLISNIRNRNFSEASNPGMYRFQKKSGFINSSCWFGDYKGNEDDYIGIRLLGSDGSIQRTVDMLMCGSDRVTFTFDQDASHGNNIGELANYLADRVQDAKNQHSSYNVRLKKVVNGYLQNYVAPDQDCYGNSYCETIKTTDSKIWDVYYDGGWKRIDLNQALIKQPVLR